MNEHLESIRDSAFFSGTVLVKQGDTTILCKGYGQAIDEIPNTASTAFHIGSVTKQFTAAAVMKLVESGAIDLHAPINQYLPSDFQSEKYKDLTPHHLLSHTSGIADYTSMENYDPEALTVDGILLDFKEKDLEFPTGEQYAYSNTGYLLLGKIIEKMSGMSYQEFIQDQIFTPAGMTHSCIPNKMYDETLGMARGHRLNEQMTSLEKEPGDDAHLCFADGGIVSTVEDLSKWSRVLDGNSPVLSKASIHQMTTPNLDNHGYGLNITTDMGQKKIAHSGGMFGFASEFRKYPESDLLIVLLTNTTDVDPSMIGKNLEQIVLHPEKDSPHIIPFPADFDFSPYLQSFHSEKYGNENVMFEKDLNQHRLVRWDPPRPCFLLSNGNIYFPVNGIEFEKQADGKLLVYCGDLSEPLDILSPVITT